MVTTILRVEFSPAACHSRGVIGIFDTRMRALGQIKPFVPGRFTKVNIE